MATTTTTIQPRMKNPAMVITEAMPAIKALYAATQKGGVPPETLQLVHLRASQINGCSFCVGSGYDHVKQADETDQRGQQPPSGYFRMLHKPGPSVSAVRPGTARYLSGPRRRPGRTTRIARRTAGRRASRRTR